MNEVFSKYYLTKSEVKNEECRLLLQVRVDIGTSNEIIQCDPFEESSTRRNVLIKNASRTCSATCPLSVQPIIYVYCLCRFYRISYETVIFATSV